MHPVIFSIGHFGIHSYGLMLAISFLFGIWIATERAKKSGLDHTVMADLGFWLIISAIVGARLYYVGLHFEEFQDDLFSIVNPFQHGQIGIGGLVMYGGFIGAFLSGLIFFRMNKMPFLPYADAVAPAFAFGEFFTRIGCFMNGCCYGMPTTSKIGVCFPMDSPAGQYQALMHAHALMPSQLFLSGGALAIGLIILIASIPKTFSGFQFYLTMALSSALRFAVDFTRYYGPGETFKGLSHNQWLCIAIFGIMVVLIIAGFVKKPGNTVDTGAATA